MGGPQVLVLLLGIPMALGTPMAIGSPIALEEGPWLGGHPIGKGAAPQRPLCRPINVTVALEKDECPQCRAVTTTACGGYCRTRDPVYRSPLSSPPQAACTYQAVRYQRWPLGGCPPGIDATVPVPVALGCRCGRCPMAAADCTVQGLGPAFCGAAGGFGPP